jgi:hypothetical protein
LRVPFGQATMTAPEAEASQMLHDISRLLLLGTVHGDNRGMSRLRRFLAQAQPRLVLLEMSPFARDFRIAHQRSYQRRLSTRLKRASAQCQMNWRSAFAHPEIAAIRRQLALPFEYRAALQYIRQTGARLVLVDQSSFSRRLIASWPELIAVGNLTTLLSLPCQREVSRIRRAYQFAHLCLEDTSFAASLPFHQVARQSEPAWSAREHYIAQQVRMAMAALKGGSTLYIGGWQHLSAVIVPPSLRTLLKVPAAQCHLLDEFE